MANSYSLDLRSRVMNDVAQGLGIGAVAAKYSISERVIFQWRDLLAETGELTPRRGKPGPKPKLERYREEIESTISNNPSITLEELKCQLNLPGCLQTLWNALHRWKIVLKKSGQSHRTAAC